MKELTEVTEGKLIIPFCNTTYKGLLKLSHVDFDCLENLCVVAHSDPPISRIAFEHILLDEGLHPCLVVVRLLGRLCCGDVTFYHFLLLRVILIIDETVRGARYYFDS